MVSSENPKLSLKVFAVLVLLAEHFVPNVVGFERVEVHIKPVLLFGTVNQSHMISQRRDSVQALAADLNSLIRGSADQYSVHPIEFTPLKNNGTKKSCFTCTRRPLDQRNLFIHSFFYSFQLSLSKVFSHLHI